MAGRDACSSEGMISPLNDMQIGFFRQCKSVLVAGLGFNALHHLHPSFTGLLHERVGCGDALARALVHNVIK